MTDSNTNDEYFSIEVTSFCTGDCIHCFAKPLRTRETELTLKEAKELANEAYEYGYRFMHITGGEPFMWEGLFSFINYCKQKGFSSCYINTNGSLISEETALKLVPYAPWLSLSISLQGEKENHEYFRGNGTYDSAWNALTVLGRHNIPADIFTVVSSGMVDSLPALVTPWYEKLKSIRFVFFIQLIQVPGAGLESHLLSPAEFITMARIASLLSVSGFRTGVLDNPLARVVCSASSLPWLPKQSHLERSGRVTVRSDKSISIAHSTTETLDYYTPGKLQGILKSTIYQEATEPDTGLCLRCPHKKLCRANGMTAPSETFRSADMSTPFCRRVLDSIQCGKDTAK